MTVARRTADARCVWMARPINYNSPLGKRPNLRRGVKIYPNRISFKELSDILH
jgi:hypothetical protein